MSLRNEIMNSSTTKLGTNEWINRNQGQETIDMSSSPRNQNAIRFIRRLSTIDETEIYHSNAETSSYEIILNVQTLTRLYTYTILQLRLSSRNKSDNEI